MIMWMMSSFKTVSSTHALDGSLISLIVDYVKYDEKGNKKNGATAAKTQAKEGKRDNE